MNQMKSKNNQNINIDKNIIISRIHNIAKKYKEEVVGKTFLLIYEGRSVEVVFKTENFLHLCGVDTTLYAKDFYRKAVKGTIKPHEIGFSDVHPYRFADIKTAHFEDALSLLKRDSLIITDISTVTKTYELGTTDFELVICFDSQTDDEGNIINNILIPYSLRIEEILNSHYNEIYEIDYVLSKSYNDSKYCKIEFGDISKLQQYLIDNNITQYSIDIETQDISVFIEKNEEYDIDL